MSFKHESKFFHAGSLTDYATSQFWQETRENLARLGAKLLTVEEANGIFFQRFFDSLCTGQSTDWPMYDCLPESDYIHIPIPYELDEHDERKIGGEFVENLIETHVKEHFSKQKYLFSGDQRECLALQFDSFSYDILHEIFSGHMTTPFVLFDENLDQCVLFHFDLCITVYSRTHKMKNLKFGGKPDSFWIDFFNENFVRGIPREIQKQIFLVNRDYVPRLPGVQKFELR